MIIFTIKTLIKYNVHIGHYKWECDYRLSYLLLGIRNSIHIINIYNTIYVLKRILYIIYNLGVINQRILIVNNINFKLKSFLDNLNKNKIWYINRKWIGGLLTNQKHLYTFNEKIFKQYYDVGYKSILPSFIFTSNMENSGSCLFESMILNIPNSSLIDSNMGFYGVMYKLSSNDDNFIVMNLFSKIIAKIYIKSIFDRKKNLIKKKEKKKKDTKRRKIVKKKKKKKIDIKHRRKKKKDTKREKYSKKKNIYIYKRKKIYLFNKKKSYRKKKKDIKRKKEKIVFKKKIVFKNNFFFKKKKFWKKEKKNLKDYSKNIYIY